MKINLLVPAFLFVMLANALHARQSISKSYYHFKGIWIFYFHFVKTGSILQEVAVIP